MFRERQWWSLGFTWEKRGKIEKPVKRAWGQTERGVVGSGQVFDFLERTTGESCLLLYLVASN